LRGILPGRLLDGAVLHQIRDHGTQRAEREQREHDPDGDLRALPFAIARRQGVAAFRLSRRNCQRCMSFFGHLS